MATVRVVGLSWDLGRRAEALLQPLSRFIDVPELRLSRTTAYVLLESVRQLHRKQAEKTVLSTSTVFLTTMLIARELARQSPATADDLLNSEMGVLRGWGVLLNGDHSQRLDALVTGFFDSVPAPSTDEFETWTADYDVRDLECGPGFRRSLTEAAQAIGTVRIDQLIRRFLDDKGNGLSMRLSQSGDQPLIAALLSPSALPGGRALHMVREADQSELTLRVEDYALAVASVLRSAKGEFTFALFGPWGSGKTTLATLIKPLLENPEEYRRKVSAADELYGRRTYQVAFHNAWKYPARPESWIYAYRSLAETANAHLGAGGRFFLALRVSMLRNGCWPLAGALLMLAFAAVPLTAKAQLAALAISFAGFFVCIYLASLTTRVTPKVRELFTRHLRLAPTAEKLGMLALVGDDVRALLEAWTRPLPGDQEDGPPDRFPWARLVLPMGALVAVAVVWAIGLFGWPGWSVGSSLMHGLSTVLPQSWVEALQAYLPKGERGSPLGETLILVGWCLLAFVMVPLPWLMNGRRPNRVLMVVDDLDRCSATEMLDVIEGMKLLVDDPIVNKRLQVLMLVDEAVLGHAIGRRFATMVEERASSSEVARSQAQAEVVAEQSEKLFACHLRFAHLSESDVTDLIVRLAGREIEVLRQQRRKQDEARLAAHNEKKAAKSEEEGSKANQQVVPDGNRAVREEGEGPAGTDNGGAGDRDPSKPIFDRSDVRFSAREIELLERLVPDYFRAIGRRPSPRAIRILLFKIQLCRHLLHLRYPARSEEDRSVEAILGAFRQAAKGAGTDPSEVATVAIARQVI